MVRDFSGRGRFRPECELSEGFPAAGAPQPLDIQVCAGLLQRAHGQLACSPNPLGSRPRDTGRQLGPQTTRVRGPDEESPGQQSLQQLFTHTRSHPVRLHSAGHTWGEVYVHGGVATAAEIRLPERPLLLPRV
ncbi:hypothetical protein GCM10009574_083200 [Streptomyces asiaticus]|uniref:Uncharacterized protein n=2 Tax=Streptomyces rhizosphaericus TaxID=114699 RepID=A0ABP4DBS2_9ACTN